MELEAQSVQDHSRSRILSIKYHQSIKYICYAYAVRLGHNLVHSWLAADNRF